jgi:hypothetical protein
MVNYHLEGRCYTLNPTISEEKIKQIKNNIPKQISFAELFTHEFMLEHTSFNRFEDFLKASKFSINSQEDFKAIPKHELDEHVSTFTDFSSWKKMCIEAGKLYFASKFSI